jgi:phage terminase small subunit
MPARKSPASLRVISRPDEFPPPEWLSVGAIEEWRAVVPKLLNARVIKATDEMALSVYCELASEFKENPVEFPAAKITQLRLLMADFGMTPHSRSAVAGDSAPSGNPFATNGKRGKSGA